MEDCSPLLSAFTWPGHTSLPSPAYEWGPAFRLKAPLKRGEKDLMKKYQIYQPHTSHMSWAEEGERILLPLECPAITIAPCKETTHAPNTITRTK